MPRAIACAETRHSRGIKPEVLGKCRLSEDSLDGVLPIIEMTRALGGCAVLPDAFDGAFRTGTGKEVNFLVSKADHRKFTHPRDGG